MTHITYRAGRPGTRSSTIKNGSATSPPHSNWNSGLRDPGKRRSSPSTRSLRVISIQSLHGPATGSSAARGRARPLLTVWISFRTTLILLDGIPHIPRMDTPDTARATNGTKRMRIKCVEHPRPCRKTCPLQAFENRRARQTDCRNGDDNSRCDSVTAALHRSLWTTMLVNSPGVHDASSVEVMDTRVTALDVIGNPPDLARYASRPRDQRSRPPRFLPRGSPHGFDPI